MAALIGRGLGSSVARSDARDAKRQSGLTMTPIMWAYVEAARETGLFGDSTSTVMRSLIMDAIRRLVADGLIERVRP